VAVADLEIWCIFIPCFTRPDLDPKAELDSTCS
jgi:hypothetical protein